MNSLKEDVRLINYLAALSWAIENARFHGRCAEGQAQRVERYISSIGEAFRAIEQGDNKNAACQRVGAALSTFLSGRGKVGMNAGLRNLRLRFNEEELPLLQPLEDLSFDGIMEAINSNDEFRSLLGLGEGQHFGDERL